MKQVLLLGAVTLVPCTGAAPTAWQFHSGLHVTTTAQAGRADADSRWAFDGERNLYDLSASLRPLWSAESGALRVVAEVQIDGTVGDTFERRTADAGEIASGNRDLFDLTSTWSEGRRHRLTAQVDRLSATWTQPWGSLTVGRHAVTWGGGLVFNPFDLFNPFAPADVFRDYKIGADLVHADLPFSDGGLQVLAVGRRAMASGTPASSASSFAALWQRHVGGLDLALLSAWHHDEPVLGAGVGGNLGAAVWRVDATWVRVRPELSVQTDAYVAAVANVQYSWVWGGRNVFGFLEYHYNGLGRSDDYAAAAQDPFVGTQLARRNVFVLGRNYAAASLQVELHPLLSGFVSAIANLGDSSLLLQPRLDWSVTQRMQLTAGLDIPIGSRGTEFGGFTPGDGVGTTRAPVAAYIRATWDF